MGSYLGDALLPRQLVISGAATVACFVVQAFAASSAGAALVQHVAPGARLDARVRRSLGLAASNMLHSLTVSVCSLWLLLTDEAAAAAPMYGHSRGAQTLAAISAGFFVWDIYVVVVRVRDPVGRTDLTLLVHGTLCLIVFVLGQYPFLPRMVPVVLFFEASTPFLNFFRIMFDLGLHESHAALYRATKKGFACAFFVSRILIGLTASAFWWRDMLRLLSEGSAEGRPLHSPAAAYFFLVANTALCALNLMWFKTIVGQALAKQKSM